MWCRWSWRWSPCPAHTRRTSSISCTQVSGPPLFWPLHFCPGTLVLALCSEKKLKYIYTFMNWKYSPVQRLGLLQELEGSKFSWFFSQCRSHRAESDWGARWSCPGLRDTSLGWRTQRGCPAQADQCQGGRHHLQPIQSTVGDQRINFSKIPWVFQVLVYCRHRRARNRIRSPLRPPHTQGVTGLWGRRWRWKSSQGSRLSRESQTWKMEI